MKKTSTRIAIAFFFAAGFNTASHAQSKAPFWSLTGNANAGSSFKLGTTRSAHLRLITNNLERMRITSKGNIGIGTTTPLEKLHVDGNTMLYGYVGINGPVLENVALNVNADFGTSGINVTDPGENFVLACQKFGGNAGIYVAKFSTASATASIAGEGINRSIGVSGRSFSNAGVYGASDQSDGVYGESYDGSGVSAYSENGFAGNFYSANSTALRAEAGPNSGAWAGFFAGDVYTSSMYMSSDRNLKTNIQDLGNAMSIINSLKPKNYQFKKDGVYAKLHLPQGNHYGLIAQDVELVMPSLVKETTQKIDMKAHAMRPKSVGGKEPAQMDTTVKTETINIKAVNYTELIPVVIKGMQEMDNKKDQQIIELQKQIDDLKAVVLKLSATMQPGTVTKGFIRQNAPNPFSASSVISYSLPQDARNAQIIVSDAKGSAVKYFRVASGEGTLNIAGTDLPSGTYTYSLYADGSKVDTKQMVVTK